MNKFFFIRATILVALFLASHTSFSQNDTLNVLENEFEVFKNYKKLGLNISPRLYFKANAKREFGSIEYPQKNGLGGGFGLDYVIRPAHKWSFRTGAHFNVLVFNKSTIFIDENDFPGDFSIESNLYSTSFLVFSIPLEVEYKKLLKDNLFLSFRGGFNFMFFGEGSFSSGYSTLRPDNSELHFFQLEASSPDRKIFPNVKLSPGVYFIYDTFMLQTSLVYQKNIPNVLEGNYQFFNLEQSEPSGGSYTMSGDYIGLEFVFFLKKSRKK